MLPCVAAGGSYSLIRQVVARDTPRRELARGTRPTSADVTAALIDLTVPVPSVVPCTQLTGVDSDQRTLSYLLPRQVYAVTERSESVYQPMILSISTFGSRLGSTTCELRLHPSRSPIHKGRAVIPAPWIHHRHTRQDATVQARHLWWPAGCSWHDKGTKCILTRLILTSVCTEYSDIPCPTKRPFHLSASHYFSPPQTQRNTPNSKQRETQRNNKSQKPSGDERCDLRRRIIS